MCSSFVESGAVVFHVLSQFNIGKCYMIHIILPNIPEKVDSRKHIAINQ